ncbi:hypothetical protein RJD40_08240 [Vibrio scophthalmi]|uniref:hypothetical protein n=1 Tax=Vibrio scophthalmi TaxID=45658 RepID=UPI003AABF687
MINITYEEIIATKSKAQLQKMKEELLTTNNFNKSENMERMDAINIELNRRKKGRSPKPAMLKQNKKLSANVTEDEDKFFKAKAKALGKTKAEMVRELCLHLTPMLTVNKVTVPVTVAEDFIADTISEAIGLLQHALMQEKLSSDDVMEIFSYLNNMQQIVTQQRQQRIGQFDEETALVIANQFLSAEQLQLLADNKALNDELSIQ